jgi:hypothetical protein
VAWRSLCWFGLLRTRSTAWPLGLGSADGMVQPALARPLRLGSADGTAQPVLSRLPTDLQLGSACEARLGWRHGAACAGSASYRLAARLGL